MARGALRMMAMMAVVAVAIGGWKKTRPTGYKLLAGTCYILDHHDRTWDKAVQYCEYKGGRLASTETESQFRALLDFTADFGSKAFWLSRNNRSGQWRWATNKLVNTKWFGRQGSGGNQCTYLCPVYRKYYPSNCGNRKRIICQVDPI